MPLKAFSKILTAASVAIALTAPAASQGQTQSAAGAKTQAAAAGAPGKPTSDAPAATQPQGAAWAMKQASASRPAETVTAHGDLLETLRASGQFTTFLKAAEATNLTAVLQKNQNLTVFAPTDAAFAALPPGKLDQLMADKPQLQKLLAHHLINARVESSKIRGAKGPVPSVAGDPIVLDGTGGALRADGATIVQSDVLAANGVLQVVDRVLTPDATTPAAAAASPEQSEIKRAPTGESGQRKR